MMTFLLASTPTDSPTALVFATFALIFSAGTLSVAYMNFRTASDKLRLDLFEKRYEVYNGIVKLLNTNPPVEWLELIGSCRDFDIATEQKRFLFDSDFQEYINQIKKRYQEYGYKFLELHGKIEAGEIFENGAMDILEPYTEWIDHLLRYELAKRFEKYLGFANVIGSGLGVMTERHLELDRTS